MDKDKLISTLILKIESLQSENIHFIGENAELKRRLSVLEERNEELLRFLRKNSNNSSKPPSSDGLKKKPSPKSSRTRSGKPSGGQSGHKGETLERSEHPDVVVNHDLAYCPHCAADMSLIGALSYEGRQVFDIPMPTVVVTEHRCAIKCCAACGKASTASFPEGVNSRVQYGRNIQSAVTYLSYQQLIPEARVRELMQDLFGLRISTGTIGNICRDSAYKMEAAQALVLDALQKSAVKHADETGFRIKGRTAWLHSLSHGSLTHYRIGPKRGAMMGGIEGILVHDHFKSYYSMPSVSHALCNAHHLRELQALIEEKEQWAMKMKKLLLMGLRAKSISAKEKVIKMYDKIIAEGISYHEQLSPFDKQSSRKKRTGHNLLIRLRDHKEEVLRFLTNPALPFTNNQAEQDIRMMKVKQKISGGFRSSHGAEQFCIARGFISTCRKQGVNIIKAINNILVDIQPHFELRDLAPG